MKVVRVRNARRVRDEWRSVLILGYDVQAGDFISLAELSAEAMTSSSGLVYGIRETTVSKPQDWIRIETVVTITCGESW